MPQILLTCLLALCLTTGAQAGTPDELATNHPGVAEVPVGEARLHRIHPRIWVHVSTWQFSDGSVFPANGLIVRDGDSLILVDSAWGEAATGQLLDTIEEDIGLPVRTAVITHFHDDRVSGAEVLRDRGVDVYATPLTRRLASRPDNTPPLTVVPGLSEPGSAVPMGPLELFYPGPGHTRDHLVVYVPGARVLFGGCAVHEAARQNAGNIADADLDAWPRSIRRVQARYPDAGIVIPGHGAPGGPNLLDHTIAVVLAQKKDRGEAE